MHRENSDGGWQYDCSIDAAAPVAVSSSKSDGGRATAHVICAVLCAISTTIAVACAYSYREDTLSTRDEYQKERNHVIELEARLHALTEQVEEMNRVRR